MVTCSVDVDRMVCVDKVVAVPRGLSMYRQLPPMFTEDVDVFEIGDSSSRRQVELIHVGKLKKTSGQQQRNL